MTKTTTSCNEYGCTVKDCHEHETARGYECNDPTDISSCNEVSVYNYDGDNVTAEGHFCRDLTDIFSCEDLNVNYNSTTQGIGCSDIADITSCSYCQGEACESLGYTNCDGQGNCCLNGSHFDGSSCVPDSSDSSD